MDLLHWIWSWASSFAFLFMWRGVTSWCNSLKNPFSTKLSKRWQKSLLSSTSTSTVYIFTMNMWTYLINDFQSIWTFDVLYQGELIYTFSQNCSATTHVISRSFNINPELSFLGASLQAESTKSLLTKVFGCVYLCQLCLHQFSVAKEGQFDFWSSWGHP